LHKAIHLPIINDLKPTITLVYCNPCIKLLPKKLKNILKFRLKSISALRSFNIFYREIQTEELNLLPEEVEKPTGI